MLGKLAAPEARVITMARRCSSRSTGLLGEIPNPGLLIPSGTLHSIRVLTNDIPVSGCEILSLSMESSYYVFVIFN